ncbi:transposase [Kitasatospora sp. NPDC004669]|uniref:transposase n=1 Tax=Kitasatospora sp. NPDC004669 TaxID=3154555 RepID=UPI0033A9ACD0
MTPFRLHEAARGTRPRPGRASRAASDLGVNHETLRQWIKTAGKAEQPTQPEPAADAAKDAEIARLRKQVRELELELAGADRPGSAAAPPAGLGPRSPRSRPARLDR